MITIYESWKKIADEIIDGNEIASFCNGYLSCTQLEEDYGLKYLHDLKVKHPEYSYQFDRMRELPGFGKYITAWFFERTGAVRR